MKRSVRDSSLIKCGKLSEYGQRGISSMTRLIWHRQHHLISWPVLNAGPYNLRKSYPAFYTAAAVADIFSPAINMPKYQAERRSSSCLYEQTGTFIQFGCIRKPRESCLRS